jgi:cytidylate kinase
MVIMPFLLSAKAKRKARAENCGEKNCRKKTYVHEEERMRRYETIYILRPNAVKMRSTELLKAPVKSFSMKREQLSRQTNGA